MTKFLTEEEIRAFARDEWAKQERERELTLQVHCRHARSGTLHDNGDVTCDQCNKVVTADDVFFGYSSLPSSAEQKSINDTKKEGA